MVRILGLLAILLTGLFVASTAPLRAAPPALPGGFTRVTHATGLNQPTAFAFLGKRIFVTEKGGDVRIIRADGTVRAKPFVSLSVSSNSERGVLGIALSPTFDQDRWVYVYYTTGEDAKNYGGEPKNRVSRFKNRKSVSVREKIILDSIPSDNGNHNGGDIHFGSDGKLYIAIGESGCGDCPPKSQQLDNLRGKLLRINPSGTIPGDNPFFNTPGARQEIYAYGFRNPWRFTERPSNQTLVVADVGAGTWEEISTLQVGGNHGWPIYEGPCRSNNLNCDPSQTDFDSTVPPLHYYNHNSGDEIGNVIAGGVFAEDSNYPDPYGGAYFYADEGAGWVHGLTLDGSNNETGHFDFDQLNCPVSFARGPDHNVYVADICDGVIYKYVYAAS